VRKVQAGYRQKTGTRIFAIGQPMGVDSSDSFYSFLTFMDAYNVKLVDDSGKLPGRRSEGARRADRRAQGLHRHLHPRLHAAVLDQLEGPDNNVAFHNKTSILTHNATISIVAKWVDDANNATLDAGAARSGQEERRREHRDRRLPEQAGRQADGLSRRPSRSA
jgi:multiple sugar transport system substrate-binding protein